MPIILDGKKARAFYTAELKKRVSGLKRFPALAIIQVGNRSESNAYIQSKIKFGQEIGVHVSHIRLEEEVNEEEVIDRVLELNRDDGIDGIVVQLPISEHLSSSKIIDAIAPNKDVDGLTTWQRTRLVKGEKGGVTPGTARGVIELLKFYGIEMKDKKVAVLGRSQLAGAPIAVALAREGSKVTICHSKTKNEEKITNDSDIVVVAIGKPNFLNENFFTAGKEQVVVDVGINSVENTVGDGGKLMEEVSGKKFVGDVDFEKVFPLVGAISPVPGGVGAMTVLGLFENLVDLASNTK